MTREELKAALRAAADDYKRATDRVLIEYVAGLNAERETEPVRSELPTHHRVVQQSGDYCDADGMSWPCAVIRAAAIA